MEINLEKNKARKCNTEERRKDEEMKVKTCDIVLYILC